MWDQAVKTETCKQRSITSRLSIISNDRTDDSSEGKMGKSDTEFLYVIRACALAQHMRDMSDVHSRVCVCVCRYEHIHLYQLFPKMNFLKWYYRLLYE